MRPRAVILVVVAFGGVSAGCEQMWNGPNDPKPTPYELRQQEEKLQQERHFGQHIAQQAPNYRERLRNGDVSGDY
jgi:hypothetical protein